MSATEENEHQSDRLLGGEHGHDEPKTCGERILTPKAVLALFTLVNFFTYFDRGAIASCLTDIRSDPSIAGDEGTISAAKGGFIVSAFMVGFMVTCPIFAALGGRFTAKQIIVFGLLVWAVACVMTGFSKSYLMILFSRMFVGVGEAAYAGFTVTIIDNIAPKASRTMWIGMFYSMIPVGTAIGMAAGGIIATDVHWHNVAGWRVVFIAEVLITAPVIILCGFLPAKYNPVKQDHAPTEEESSPAVNGEEEQKEGEEGTEHVGLIDALKGLIRNVNYILVVFGYGMYVFVTGALAVWAISMLIQGPLRMGTIEASSIMGGATALTGLLGSIVGGLFVDKMGGSQGYSGMLKCQYFNILMMVISIPCGMIAMMSEVLWLFCIFFVLSVFALFSVTAPVNASILSSVNPALRTYAISFSILGIHGMGDFPSPALTGFISDKFGNGCPGHKDENSCLLHPNEHCVWIKPPKGSIDNPFCANTYQLRNALMIVYAFLFLAIPAWGIVAIRVKKLVKQEEAEKLAQEAVGTVENPSIVGLHEDDAESMKSESRLGKK